MENSASAVVEQQQGTSQKSKKKSKNKKQTGKYSINSSPVVDEDHKSQRIETENCEKRTAEDAAIMENRLCRKLEQQLDIASDGHQMNGIKENNFAHAHTADHTRGHATLNGHHTPADTPNGTCLPPSEAVVMAESGKKSRSKSNKLKNKEAALRCDSDAPSRACSEDKTAEAAVDDVQSKGSIPAKTSSRAPVAAGETACEQLKNGFSHDGDTGSAAGSDQAEDIETLKKANQAPVSTPSVSTTNDCTTQTERQKHKPSPIDTTTSAEALTSEGPCEAATAATASSSNAQATAAATANSNTAKSNVACAVTASEATGTQSPQISPALEPTATAEQAALDLTNVHIEYKEYESELQMHDIMRLIQAELSEPYSIYTYRYFIYNWPKLCFLAAHGSEYVGAIVCKLDMHMNVRRGYIAMLAVRKEYRKLKIGTTLVQKAIEAMLADNADEVVLETEMRNVPALRLYENLGFVRDKRLFRYYLNGVDALRLKLWFR